MATVSHRGRKPGYWADAVTVGAVRLSVTAAGRVVGWRLDGRLSALSPADRVRLAAVFRTMAGAGGNLWDVYVFLFPSRDGGSGGPRTGVHYVHPD